MQLQQNIFISKILGIILKENEQFAPKVIKFVSADDSQGAVVVPHKATIKKFRASIFGTVVVVPNKSYVTTCE